MRLCYDCGNSLTNANKSREHIILKALGGRLKSYDLLCNICNREFSQDIDSELAADLNSIANLFDITRDDQESPKNITALGKITGEEYTIRPGGHPIPIKPIYSDQPEGETIKIHVKAVNEKQANKTADGLLKKHGVKNADEVKRNISTEMEFIEEPIRLEFCFGKLNPLRSLCKSAANFYMYNGGNRKYISHLLPFIKCKVDIDCTFYHYPDKDIIKKDEPELLHSIILIGNNDEKVLYSYIELFSFYKVIVLLNDNYSGDPIRVGYCYDVVYNMVVEKPFSLYLPLSSLKSIVSEKVVPIKLNMELERILNLARKKQEHELLNSILAEPHRYGDFDEAELTQIRDVLANEENAVKSIRFEYKNE